MVIGTNGAGRFAPSPTGDLHLGNLRTALVAWLAARAAGLGFVVRMEDLDRVTSSPEHERRQLADLAAIGLDWDGAVVRQSERFDRYRAAIERLRRDGRVYPCYCTRREIRAEIDAAAAAPHVHLPDGAYPGTCRDLTDAQRDAARRRRAAARRCGCARTASRSARRRPIAGRYAGAVDDVVLARADGVPAYNLAVVVDDAAQAVTQVVRGDDLLSSTPRQILLQRLLGTPMPEYLHVPLVLGADGAAARQASRRGHARRPRRATAGAPATCVDVWRVRWVWPRRGEPVDADQLVERFDPASLPRAAVAWRPAALTSAKPIGTLRRCDDLDDDLRTILTYGDAVDDDGELEMDEVGAELYCVPFWTPAFCAAVIRAAELVGFEPDPDDPVPGHEVSLAAISPALYAAVQDDVGHADLAATADGVAADRVPRAARRVRDPLPPRRAGVVAAPSGHRPGFGDGAAQRRLRRAPRSSSRVRATTTPTQPLGSLLAWPSLVTHPHEAGQLTKGSSTGSRSGASCPATLRSTDRVSSPSATLTSLIAAKMFSKLSRKSHRRDRIVDRAPR